MNAELEFKVSVTATITRADGTIEEIVYEDVQATESTLTQE